MSMVRRLYEEDSSVEEFEDYPLYRIPRLHGGQGPAGENDASDSDSQDVNAPRGRPRRRYSAIHAQRVDKFNYLQRLYYADHKFGSEIKRNLRHRCQICHQDRVGPKVKCIQCKMLVHSECKSAMPEDIPSPCIHPTPMSDINEPDLKESLIHLPVEIPRVPAILVKCFYELQEEDRIRTFNLYEPLPTSAHERAPFVKLSKQLRRHVSRDLNSVSTPTISGCVLQFLFDIRTQLMLPENDAALTALQRNHSNRPDVYKQKVTEYVDGNIVDHHRLQTLAALMLHLHTIRAFEDQNKMTEKRIIDVFQPLFQSIDVLIVIEPLFWVMKLVAPNVAVEPAPRRMSRTAKVAHSVKRRFSAL